ncbi:CIC11C00000005715 [Sungouiella intermedia]|uniref:CIC11C00000005715 n=1 Tax=Sungouiella intermedia TaxID=45354 RepID=A0A1L0B9E1_9ASCO|nr:CIC11C00000005715 [[Candida] intermedia]
MGGIVPKVAAKYTEIQPPIPINPHIESQRQVVGYDYENDNNCGNELQTLSLQSIFIRESFYFRVSIYIRESVF